MKFNGELWMNIPVTQKGKNEPDEFVVVKNKKFGGGLIPYARFGKNWSTTVPNRVLIRELLLLVDKSESKSLDWEGVKKHFDDVHRSYKNLIGKPGVNVQFALEHVFKPLAERFDKGERSEKLFNEMWEVE